MSPKLTGSQAPAPAVARRPERAPMRPLHRGPLIFGLASLILAGLWAVAATWIVPPLIARAYREESFPIFNEVISGRALFGVEYYLNLWSGIAWRGAVALLTAALAGTTLSIPRVSDLLDARLGGDIRRRAVQNVGIPAGRLRIIYTAIAVVVGGSLFTLVSDTEFWPFSSYSMYAQLQPGYSLTALRCFGVTVADPPREIPLLAPADIAPFDQGRLRIALEHLDGTARRDELLPAALRDILKRYTSRRNAGHHAGPALRAIRLYRLHWELDPWARNVADPSQKDLLFEVLDAPAPRTP